MDKEELKKLADDPDNIPGIYNYCDRWCERCSFTSRCLNFKMSEEKFGDQENIDANNTAFWEKLAETLHETLELLKEMAEEQGIDLNSIDVEEAKQYRREFEDNNVVHVIEHLSKSYITTVDEWFDNDMYMVGDETNESDLEDNTASIDALSEKDTITMKDNVEVIRWYQHQIYVKLRRALKSAQMEKTEDWDDDQKDSDGSAKVALIGIDRSISAWGKILDYFSWQKKGILNIIAYLKRLSHIIENEFPNARSFVRPGFDEMNT
jgi:hypothetical protein